MNLIEKQLEIFCELENKLVLIAKKFKVHDPKGEARSWFVKYQEIIKGFEEGRYIKKYRDETGEIRILPENPTDEQKKAFYKTLLSYLKKSFEHYLIQHYNIQKKYVFEGGTELDSYNNKSFTKNMSSQKSILSFRPTPEDLHLNAESLKFSDKDIILLSDMVGLIKSDIIRDEKIAIVARDKLSVLVLRAILNYYEQMLNEFGDFPIVKDLFAEDVKDFFIYDIREGRPDGIKAHLLKLINEEKLKSVKLMSRKVLVDDEKSNALGRRISRYMNERYGGMPYRLRKLKEQERVLK